MGELGLGFGFWTFGYHIVRSLGNHIIKHSPTRGCSLELGAAITVLLATRLGLPMSTTQCITGAVIGVSLSSTATCAASTGASSARSSSAGC